MKFLIYSKIVLAIISLVLSTGLKSQNRAGLKNQRSAVEFFNSILLQQNTTDNNSSAGNDTVPSDPVEPYMSDWLMISSELFNNPLIFPPVLVNSGEKIKIKTDPNLFRLNSAFKEGFNSTTDPPTDRFFWFRVSGSNLYYSSTSSDYNVLGAINAKSINNVKSNDLRNPDTLFCFKVIDYEDNKWKLCAQTVEIRNKWVCRLQKVLKVPLESFCSFNNNPDPEVITKKEIQPVIIIPTPSPFCNQNWNYQQNGHDWECDCSEGKSQTPIDLPLKEKAIDSPVKPLFQYSETQVKSSETTIDKQQISGESVKLKLEDNTLKIYHQNFGKIITLDGAIYHAQEIIIHTPAEHKIDGKSYDMEIQIVHYGMTVGDIAKQVVLSFLFEKKAGVYNKFIDDLDMFNLPNPLSKEVDLTINIFIPKILYSSEDYGEPVMKPFSFYTYDGSLSFPPCTENTIIYVASKIQPISSTALQLFQETLRIPDLMNQKGDIIVSDWIPISNRDVQPINGRPIFHFDHEKYCGPDAPRPPVNNPGHYEKVMNAATKYFYVSDTKPSGLPGAFVVSSEEALGKPITKIR